MTGSPKDSQDPARAASPVRFAVPDNACDCHLHFYGPLAEYPVVHDAVYDVPDATPDSFIAEQRRAGLSRGVVVHAVASGRDNRRTLDALRAYPDRFRGVVTPPLEATSDATLNAWDLLGVRGVRFSYVGNPAPGMAIDDALISRITDLGWHAQVHVAGEQIIELTDRLLALPCPVVIDHMARIPASLGIDSPAFQALLRLVDSGKVWVKLSAPMRLSSASAPPWADVTPLARALVERAHERMLWASDWPHVNFKGTVPDYPRLLDLLFDWAPKRAQLERILVGNPGRLYRFD